MSEAGVSRNSHKFPWRVQSPLLTAPHTHVITGSTAASVTQSVSVEICVVDVALRWGMMLYELSLGSVGRLDGEEGHLFASSFHPADPRCMNLISEVFAGLEFQVIHIQPSLRTHSTQFPVRSTNYSELCSQRPYRTGPMQRMR